ncbi:MULTISPECIES: glycoside hydrolase family 10 protein [unclassified Arenibacter]|uniref:glycoside hydrolase family 10 protein n=1 Tax=unclassified Arenibacter TaxID=2615047 RepID=UPI000E34A232|nr:MULTISPECIES: family 10 glycosylhydrolase [unclassified Arenibacter]MCM4165655.1 glycosyl hydrolase [Arenibacter sp. A80]RFT54800.1 glycosyl hydrolase [Arenibacter sp. P308M17]
MFKRIFILLSLVLTSSCSVFQSSIPTPKHELRGVWIATVVNIDWPKNGLDDIEKQKQDYLKILDFYENLNFNAVIVQIRAAGDAFYPSQYAPWSRFLTGNEGIAPQPYYDPMEWMVQEAHARGMEFHAWLNPYRATFDEKLEILSEDHDYYQHPDWMLKYGKKYYYNPGLPEVQQHLTDIIAEVVTNYDIDAVHFDDYFYPYKITGETFEDRETYIKYALPQQSLEDWRRSNIDSLVQKVHNTIKSKKPWVQFGISPFGVWKNNSTDPRGSDTKAGQTTYEDLYADPLLWMKNGWIDYLVPQVYWSMDLPAASHKKIVDWWSKNSHNTNLYIGNGPYKIRNNSDRAWDRKKELPNQLKFARENKNVIGNVFFSAKSLMSNKEDVLRILKKKYYHKMALPPSPPLPINVFQNRIVETRFEEKEGILYFSIPPQERQNLSYALVYVAKKESKLNLENTDNLVSKIPLSESGNFSFDPSKFKGKKILALSFINNFGQESRPKIIRIN